MNSLQKKRQAFRQAIRSKSIQDIFRRKRQELLEQLKQNMQKENNCIQSYNHHYHGAHTSFNHLVGNNFHADSYSDLKKILTQIEQQIGPKEQQHIFVIITVNHNFESLQKIDLLSRLINRKQFCLDSQIQHHYGWKILIQEFLGTIMGSQEQKGDNLNTVQQFQFLVKDKEFNTNEKIQTAGLKNMLCFSLIKLWQLKPKNQYFLIFTKSYHLIHQKLSNIISLTLIAELSYDRILLPNPQFITKMLQVNIDKLTEVKFFRTLQILKNFIFYFKVENSQIHARQLIFEYVNWIKIQINLLLSSNENNQSHSFSMSPISQSTQGLLSDQTEFETRYCLIYLLFTTLNKLFEVNEKQKQHLETKQIMILNEELLNHRQNHTTMKFMIQEGKAATDPHHKNNILRTLTFLINLLEIFTMEKNKEQNNLGAELQQIEKTFQGTQLDWFGTFN